MTDASYDDKRFFFYHAINHAIRPDTDAVVIHSAVQFFAGIRIAGNNRQENGNLILFSWRDGVYSFLNARLEDYEKRHRTFSLYRP